MGPMLFALTLAVHALRLQPVVAETRQAKAEFVPESGQLIITIPSGSWHLSESFSGLTKPVRMIGGKDEIGPYQGLSIDWAAAVALHGEIRIYRDRPAIQFKLSYLEGESGHGTRFPAFDTFTLPKTGFSYADRTFAGPATKLADTSTPWLMFDARGAAVVFSPASSFMTATMTSSPVGVEQDHALASISKGFRQDSLLVFGQGIASTWDAWGETMRALYSKNTPANDTDPVLKYFGYWTDNGADYYYNYDLDKGYEGTLLALRERYKAEGIPLGYMQLDSWWYDKSIDDPSGRSGGATKNSKLPDGAWNRYGGLMTYRADQDLFPDGLKSFQSKLGLPLVVHNRWMDRNSPYHQQYKISGVAAIDPKFWNDVADYLKSSGVICYEQDWLDQIFLNSPEMRQTPDTGDLFTDGMANACRSHGLTMQYCMPTPRYFLQALQYPNLTTIRTSDDRFEPGKWRHFLYTSQLAQAAGIWPWADVFKSHETGNMLLATLSAGPVGTGDAMGKEDAANILMTARPDGVIVKPDRSIVPTDLAYQQDAAASTEPMMASTYTDHGSSKTHYVFLFPRQAKERTTTFSLREVGVNESAEVYNWVTGTAEIHGPDDPIPVEIGKEGFSYYIAAPIGPSKMSILGDLGKFVSAGKQRLPAMEPTPNGWRVRVSFAKGEGPVTLRGYSEVKPAIEARLGKSELKAYDTQTKAFTVTVAPAPGRTTAELKIHA